MYTSSYVVRVVRLRRLRGLSHAWEKCESDERLVRRDLLGYLDVCRRILKWIQLVHNVGQWQTLVNTVINLGVP
jgi:hypothetical protein